MVAGGNGPLPVFSHLGGLWWTLDPYQRCSMTVVISSMPLSGTKMPFPKTWTTELLVNATETGKLNSWHGPWKSKEAMGQKWL